MISEIKPIKARTTEERLARLEGILEQVTRNYATMAERFNMMAEGYMVLLDEREKADAMRKG
jgi:hypothetical protein